MAVIECRSFTKAAERLSLSQPTVSVHIKNLESYFGVKLIERSVKQKHIAITDSGYLLYRRSKDIIGTLEATRGELKDNASSLRGHIRIGASFTIGECILPKLLAEFNRKYEDVELEVIIGNTNEICEKVRNLNLDIGLIEGVASSFDFDKEYFYEDRMVLMLPKGHPASVLDKGFSYDKLQNLKWVSRERGSGTRDYLNIFLTENQIIPKSIAVLGSNQAVKEAVKNGMGITLISRYVAEDAWAKGEVEIVEPEVEYIRHFSYITHRSMSMSDSLKVFLKELVV